jgi:hypothetical protein
MNHIVEEETGTCAARPRRAHNGYWAGDFATVPFHLPDLHQLLALTSACTTSARRTPA